MGVLSPNCVATDGTSLYALTRTNKYGESDNKYHVLIKSNASPASIRDISWTLVSAVPRSANNYLTGKYACTVNEKGVFTVVSDKAQVSETFTGAVGFKGIQFVPGSSGVEGSWRNLDTEGFFTEWPYKMSGFMFNFKDSSGISTPMVTYIHSSSKAPFVAAMNPEGNKLLGGVVSWNMVHKVRCMPGFFQVIKMVYVLIILVNYYLVPTFKCSQPPHMESQCRSWDWITNCLYTVTTTSGRTTP